MSKVLLSLLLSAAAALGQYAMQPAGAPPSELAPAIIAELQQEGVKIVSDDGAVFCEIWLRTQAPQGPESSEIDVTWTTVPHGALIGALRFPQDGADRRGQKIAPGVYTLRFSYYPVDGAHEGVEPSRDFLMLTPADSDRDPNAQPGFDELMEMSSKSSGGFHPACLSMWKPDEGDFQEGFAKLGDYDWVLSTKIGDMPVNIILIGVNEHDRI